jgi:hypothetical protein
MLEVITASISTAVIRDEDSYILGIMTQWKDGKNRFIPFRSGKDYDEIRPYLLRCQAIDISGESDICNAYWEILSRDRAGDLFLRPSFDLFPKAFGNGLASLGETNCESSRA